MLFFQDTTRRLLREIEEKGLETEAERVKHEVDYYANLLADPEAMEEFRAEVAAHREKRLALKQKEEEEEDRDLQEIEIVRQNVTFINCHFEGNTYGEKSEATNYGTIGVETDDNDCVVKGCKFTGNQFGDVNIVVSALASSSKLTPCQVVLSLASLTTSGSAFQLSVFVGNQFRDQYRQRRHS